MQYAYSLNYSGTRFLSIELKISQFPGGFRLKVISPYNKNVMGKISSQ